MKKYISILLAAVLVLACLSACGTSDKPADADNSEKLSVVTTIFPQYDFTRQIVGDKADVTMLLKPGAESHSYEPTPQDIKTIQNCDLFIYTGGENDVWVDDILNSMGDQRPDTLRLIDCVPTVNEEIVEGMEHEHDHDHGEIVESDIKARPLSDFAGDFQSVLPYFEDGTLDEYITEEAEKNEKSFDEMKQEFLEKRKSDYNTLSIEGNSVSFHTPSGTVSAEYEYQGLQTVKDDDGDITSVWYTFQAKTPDSGAPVYLAFNDHGTGAGSHEEEHEEHEEEIAHFHLRYGNESVEALMGVENWAPTFYAADAAADEIKEALAGHSHEHEEEPDEHVWTSPKNAIEIVDKITSLICGKDPKNDDSYEKNSADYKEQLEQLDASFREVVDSAKRKTILFGDRFPFRYFADEYGLSYYAAFTGCSTETEASAATVAFLTDKVKEEQIPVVFTIELSNGKIADSICEATGAKKMTLYSCHNVTKEQMENGATYLSMMMENVDSLRAALN